MRKSLILSLVLTPYLALVIGHSARVSNSQTAIPSPGASATLLPDGRWLLLGGEGANGPLSTARIFDPRADSIAPLATGLQHARAWHTATLLPEGTVLILGGFGAGGQVIDSAESYAPETQEFKTLSATSLTPRAHHTATLLTEGRVLIAGGADRMGETLRKLELWDPRAKTASTLQVGLLTARRNHTATLLANGTVHFWGGKDRNGAALSYGEVFDPETQGIRMETSPIQPSTQPPRLAASLPEDGAINVPLDMVIALRFSEPLRVETVNVTTVTLQGPQGAVAAKVIPAEAGMLAFITPQSPLLPGTTYTLALVGPTDEAGQRLPDTTITFTTVGTTVGAGVTGQTPPSEPEGATGAAVQPVPPLLAPLGVTAVSGRVLKLNGDPLANVTLQVRGITARTDSTGRFLLAPLASGHQVMFIDGRTASIPGSTYGTFEVGVNLLAGRTNVLPYTIWMPLLDMAHAVTIPSPTQSEIIITTPLLPNLELRIPAQTVVRDHEGRVVQQISITPIPLDRPPFPLAKGVDVPIYFTIQPGAAYLQNPNRVGARLIYPNVRNARPGTRFDFWNYDPDARGWYVYGQGTVTADRRQIVPDPGVVIYEFTGAMVAPPSFAPAIGPSAGGAKDGEPVDLATGLFVYEKTDLALSDVLPINLRRTYRQLDPRPRTFGIGTTHNYDIFLVGDTSLGNTPHYTYQELILPDGARIHYDRTSPCRPGQPTICDFADAIYAHTSTPTAFHGSGISYDFGANGGAGGWLLRLKDGTVYEFPDSEFAQRPQQAAVIGIRDRYGNTVSLARDSNGNLTQITSPNGRWIKFSYETCNGLPPLKRVSTATDNIGRQVTYQYDSPDCAAGRLFRVTDARGGITTYTYDERPGHTTNMLTIRDARGFVYLTNVYDDTTNRVRMQTQIDTSTYRFGYTLDTGETTIIQTDVTDPRDNLRTVTFNANGYARTDTRAFGTPEQQVITYDRHPLTNLVGSLTDPLGHVTRYTYYPSGTVQTITTLAEDTTAAATTSFEYEPVFNQLTKITDPLNHPTSFFYYPNGSLRSVKDALQNETTFTNNLSGQPTTITDPLGNPPVRFSYEFGDLVGMTDPLNQTTTFFSDAAGRPAVVTNPLGQATRYQYNAFNQVAQITDPLGGVTRFDYDPNGNLLRVTDPRQNLTRYDYDNMDRLITRTDPLLHSERYDEYDLAGNLKQFTDRRGKITTFGYDALNRRKFAGFGRTAGPPVAYESTIDYAYDGLNRLTQATDSLGRSVTRTYNDLARTMVETTPLGSITYSYDAAGRRTSMVVAGQPDITYAYEYDNANGLRTITQGSSAVRFDYDNDNRLQSLTLPTLPNRLVVTYSYHAASQQLTGITYQLGTTPLGGLTYDYDAAGRRTSMGGSFARTDLPLPVSVSPTDYDAANRLTRWAGATLTYDLNGNLTGDGTNTYTWDARNQLTAISGPAAATFQYDAFGRRTSKTIGGINFNTQFLYDGVNPVQELAGTPPTPVANLLTGFGVDEYFTRTDIAGPQHFLTDALGSTLALTDSAGALQTQYTYEPFGRTTATGGDRGSSYQYTGRENDGAGLYYYRARYYNPTLQRFISEDPIQFFGGMNLYVYSDADPVNNIDPDGHFIPPNHRIITREAGRAAGLSPADAEALARAVADVDSRSGSQGTDAASANMHAMSGRKPNRKRWQICQEAFQGTQDQIQEATHSGDIPRVVHTIEDAWSPSHQGFPQWHGIPTLAHIWGDTFPPFSNVSEAGSNVRQFLEDLEAFRSGRAPINPAKYLPPNPCLP